MNKEEIKYTMAIIRSAIWALYGRQKLILNGYSMLKVRRYYDELFFPLLSGETCNVSGWFEVLGVDYVFKLRIEKDIVTHLGIGELNI